MSTNTDRDTETDLVLEVAPPEVGHLKKQEATLYSISKGEDY